MTVTNKESDQEARNRWAEQHRAKTQAKRDTVGWNNRAQARAARSRQEARLDTIEGDALCPGPSVASDMIAVCIQVPGGADGDLLSESIKSILGGTHRNVQVIVMTDPELSPWVVEDLADEVVGSGRVLLVEAEHGGGQPNARYAAAVRLTPAPYIAFQGAHDQSKPTRLEDQLSAIISTGADACFVPVEQPGNRQTLHAGVAPSPSLDGEMAPAAGLFRTDAIRRLGGILPEAGGLRLLTCAISLLGRVATTKKPLYVRHSSHLVDEPDGAASELWAAAFLAAGTSVATALHTLNSALLRSRDRTVSDGAWGGLAVALPLPSQAFVERALRTLFDDPEMEDARADALALLVELDEHRPAGVLLAGASMPALVVAAMYGRATGKAPVVLEDSAVDAAAARKLLGTLGLEDDTDVRYAEVKDTLADPVGYVWYSVDAEDLAAAGGLDYVYAAGPQGESRHGALLALGGALQTGSRLRIVGDAEKEKTIKIWAAQRHLAIRDRGPDGMDVQLIEDPESAAGVAVTILTGSRHKLLHRTLKALAEHDPRLVEEGQVFVLVNGGDEDSVKVAGKFPWVDHIETTDSILRVGPALTTLMAMVSSESQYVLHLEDDWECKGDGWRQRALSLLRRDESVGQVVLATTEGGGPSLNPVSGRRITWEACRSPRGFRYRTAAAAWTFHPSISRYETVEALLPLENEVDAMEAYHELGHNEVARLHDAPFHHIGGGGNSLREKLGR